MRGTEIKKIDEKDDTIVRVPVVVEPIRVPIELTVVPVRTRHIRVAVLIAKHDVKNLPCHYPQKSSIIVARLYRIWHF